MAEVVGTAFVRIRALTKDLAKDIQSGLKKGVADADVDAAGADVGERFAASAKEAITDGVSGAVTEATDDVSKDPDVERHGRRTGALFSDGFADEAFARLKKTNIGKKFSTSFSFNKEGKKAGDQFGQGFAGGVLKGFAKLAPLLAVFGSVFSPLIADAAQVLLSYVVGLVAQLGFLTTAAIGAGAAMGSAFAAAGFALIPLLLAFKTETPALERFKKQAEAVGKAWESVGRATQRRLLPGLTRALNATRSLIPMFREFGGIIGGIAGAYATLTAGIIRSETFQRRLSAILDSSTRIFDDLLDIVLRVGDILSIIFVASLPIAERFAQSISDMVTRWQLLLTAGEQTGSLQTTLTIWYDRAVLLFGALGDIIVGIFNILQIGGDSAVPLFDRFDTWAANFRAFTSSEIGQNRIKQIFDNALPVMQEVNGIVAAIFDGMFNRLGEPGGTTSLVGGLQTIREAIPGIKETLGTFIDDMRQPLEDLGEAAFTFIRAFDDIGGLEAFVVLITQLFEALNALLSIPGFGTFLAVILSFTAALSILTKLGILPVLQGILTVIGAIFGIGTAGAALVVGFFVAFYTAVLKLKPVLAAVAAVIGIVGGVIAAVFGAPLVAAIGVMAALGAAIGLFVRNFDTIVEALGDAAAAIGRFFADPMERLEAFFAALGSLAGTVGEFLGEHLGNFLEAIPGFFSDLGETILDAMGDIGGVIAEGLSDAGGALLDFLRSLPGRAVDALRALGGLLGRAFVAAVEGAFDLFFTAVGLGINLFLNQFLAVPVLIVRALAELGPMLASAFLAAIQFLLDALVAGIGTVVDFFIALPGAIVTALVGLRDALVGVFVAAFNFLVGSGPGIIEGILAFFRELPGNIVTALVNLRDFLLGVFTGALDAVRTFVIERTDEIFQFFKDLPGRLLLLVQDFIDAGAALIGGLIDGLSDIGSTALTFARNFANTIIRFINENIIDNINDAIDDISIAGFDVGPSDLLPHIPELALGGVVTSPTLAMLGEKFKPEVVIPLTNPARARQLAMESGLLNILNEGRPGDVSRTTSSTGPAGPLIEHVTIMTPDPDRSARAIINSLTGISHAVGGHN